MDRVEAERRASNRAKLEDLFKERPGRWISWQELSEVAGACAWRTRVSDLRLMCHMHIENRTTRLTLTDGTRVVMSEYRYLPHTPLGRDAGVYVEQKDLF